MGGEQCFPMHWEELVFMTFLKFSLKCREGNSCREAASNALTGVPCVVLRPSTSV